MRLPAPLGVLVLATCIAVPAGARPVITEVCWMGSNSVTSEEWVEIYNAGDEPIATETFVLLQGATARPLPAGTLAPGAFLVLERQGNDAATPLTPPDAVPFSFGQGLTNGGQVLCLCPTGTTTCDAVTCDVANLAGDAWASGNNTAPKRTMERVDPDLDGTLESSWQDGNPSSPGALSPVSPDVQDAGAPADSGPPTLADAGPPATDADAGTSPVDAGVLPLDDAGPVNRPDAGIADAGTSDAGAGTVDAGANAAPVIRVLEPAGPVEGSELTVTWEATDPDPGDTVTVELYWSLDDVGNDGTRFARGLPGGDGSPQTATFDVSTFDVSTFPVARFYILAIARDDSGNAGYAYAPGVVALTPGGGAQASLRVTEPNGVNDDSDDGAAVIAWELTLPPGATGSVSLHLDDNNAGADGVTIQGGLSADADGPRAFRLPLEGVAPGEHWVYAVLDYAGPSGLGQVVAYADAALVVDGAGGCTAQGRFPSSGLLLVATLAILARIRSFPGRPLNDFRRASTRRP